MRKLIPKKALLLLMVVFCGVVMQHCTSESAEESADYRLATDVALEWNRMMLHLERHTKGYRPPVSARAFAYIAMAGYEASLPALNDYISLSRYCAGYESSSFRSQGNSYFLPMGLNAAYAQMMRYFFPDAPKKWRDKVDQLETHFAQVCSKQASIEHLEHSAAYGRAVADAVWRWSATDEEGHNAFLFNFDKNYVAPSCKGCWQPDKRHPMPALLPNWGDVRGFVIRQGDVQTTPPASFDETPGSPFFTEAMEVFSVSQPLSRENHWIAELWSDDLPGLTVTPAGRWIAIANQAIEQARPPYPIVAETYLKVAWAVCDVGIVTWQAKYAYNLERPEAYIQRNIKSDWTSLHDNPPFPAYPSGHSAFGAAAAEVLASELGERFELTDRTHEHRQEFVGKPRTYQSFMEMAKENAASRVFLGVHYRMDCEEGLRLGKIVGQKVARLPLHRKEASLLR